MELSKKTTILLSYSQHKQLAELATASNTSIGHLIRSACSRVYGVRTIEERLKAVERMAAMSLPVGTVEEMEHESVPVIEG